MTVRALPLLSNYSTANLSAPWVSPELPREMADALVVVTAEALSGGPATATVSPTFQVWHSILGGNQEEVYSGAAGVDPTNSWYDIAAASNPSMLPDGDWPAALDVSGATLTTPVGVFRTIRGGFPWRVKLNWALTGGTSPTIKLSVIAYVRERFVGGFDRVESGT